VPGAYQSPLAPVRDVAELGAALGHDVPVQRQRVESRLSGRADGHEMDAVLGLWVPEIVSPYAAWAYS
jgi:hypothetical protein